MSLLDDFETLEKRQTDSIEYYLSFLVLKDRYPITMNLDEFSKEYYTFQSYGGTYDPNHCYRARTNLMEGRVYIACGVDGSNVSKFASERLILIGTLDDGFRKITSDELHQYMGLYMKQWPDSDYTYTLNQTIHYLLNNFIYNPYSIPNPIGYVSVDEWKNGKITLY